jgi:putative membrane protein
MKISDHLAKIRWAILIAILITNIWVVHNPALSFLIFLAPAVWALLHSFENFGRKHTAIIFSIIVIISFAAEYIGVHTGQLFGPYFYNPSHAVNGFLWGGVPPLVTFSYISIGYASYMVARIILGFPGKIKGAAIVGVPVLASMLTTIWDMSFDPIASYVHKIYTWYEGGAYFGVPFRNFTGWFLESLVFFGLVTLYLQTIPKAKDFLKKPSALFLGEAVFLMAANAFGTIVKEFNSPTAVQQSMALIALFGLGIPIITATFQLLQRRKA